MEQRATRAGWYTDPEEPAQRRWWDGSAWTRHVATDDEVDEYGTSTLQLLPDIAPAELGDRWAPFAAMTSQFGWAEWFLMSLSIIGGALLAWYGVVLHNRFAADSVDAKAASYLLVIGVVFILVPMNIVREAYRGERLRFWRSWVKRRGLKRDNEATFSNAQTPLLTASEWRSFPMMARGKLDGHDAHVGVYAYRTDSRSSMWGARPLGLDNAFTIVTFELPPAIAERFAGISVRRRRADAELRDVMLGTPEEFESIELREKLCCYTADGQDPIAVRELFEPLFMTELIAHATQWDQRASELVVFEPGLPRSDESLNDLCRRAVIVLEQYLRCAG